MFDTVSLWGNTVFHKVTVYPKVVFRSALCLLTLFKNLLYSTDFVFLLFLFTAEISISSFTTQCSEMSTISVWFKPPQWLVSECKCRLFASESWGRELQKGNYLRLISGASSPPLLPLFTRTQNQQLRTWKKSIIFLWDSKKKAPEAFRMLSSCL